MDRRTFKGTTFVIPPISIPPLSPPSKEELARRRKVADRAWALREQIGPIGVSTSDLIRQVREETDGEDD